MIACYTNQCNKKMVQDKVDGHQRSQRLVGPQHGFIHYLNPGLLSQNLEHGHESLEQYSHCSNDF